MEPSPRPSVAIIDFGLGNLFSVKRACEFAGMNGTITSDKSFVLRADAVLLPGVGAFGDAIQNLHRLDLVKPIQDIAQSPKPLMGVCLGLQLLMEESSEFGTHQGLGIIPGQVVRFRDTQDHQGRAFKVPHVGWNKIHPVPSNGWSNSLLRSCRPGEYMYFVHSYHVVPDDPRTSLCVTNYAHSEFCSAVERGNVTAFQFHPERSGQAGLAIYQHLRERISASKEWKNAA